MGWLWGSKGRGAQVTEIDDNDSPYTVDPNDFAIRCNCLNGEITVVMPAIALSLNRIINVKKTDPSPNAVTIDGTIDGEASAVFAVQYTALDLQADSSEWGVI
jgi:hypothetical protein